MWPLGRPARSRVIYNISRVGTTRWHQWVGAVAIYCPIRSECNKPHAPSASLPGEIAMVKRLLGLSFTDWHVLKPEAQSTLGHRHGPVCELCGSGGPRTKELKKLELAPCGSSVTESGSSITFLFFPPNNTFACFPLLFADIDYCTCKFHLQ